MPRLASAICAMAYVSVAVGSLAVACWLVSVGAWPLAVMPAGLFFLIVYAGVVKVMSLVMGEDDEYGMW